MASVIRFGTLALPLSATSISASTAPELNYLDGHYEPQYAVLSKNRHSFANTPIASIYASQQFTYDMGSTTNRTIDYFAVLKIDRLQKAADSNLDIILQTDADGAGTFTDRNQINYTYTASRHSPRDEDYIQEFTAVTTNHRYYRVYMQRDTTATGQVWQATGFFFGELFDIGADPIDFSARHDMKQGELLSENGSAHYAPTNYKPIEFTVSFMGITDAKVLALQGMIETANRYGIILYCTNTDLTDGYSMCHCDNVRVEVKRIWTNYNSVTIKLTEVY